MTASRFPVSRNSPCGFSRRKGALFCGYLHLILSVAVVLMTFVLGMCPELGMPFTAEGTPDDSDHFMSLLKMKLAADRDDSVQRNETLRAMSDLDTMSLIKLRIKLIPVFSTSLMDVALTLFLFYSIHKRSVSLLGQWIACQLTLAIQPLGLLMMSSVLGLVLGPLFFGILGYFTLIALFVTFGCDMCSILVVSAYYKELGSKNQPDRKV